MATLDNMLYFPCFRELPVADEYDLSYYVEHPNQDITPNRTWCFVGEIVSDALSQMPVLGNRVEVRDIHGDVRSILFYPEEGYLDFQLLKAGHTVFIRYAQRCYFSDLMSDAIKVVDLDFVKVIPTNLDTLLFLSQLYFQHQSSCHQCGRDLSGSSGGAVKCPFCQTARFCGVECMRAASDGHQQVCAHCEDLSEVLNIDFERFTQYVPFRATCAYAL